ncbi:MAG: hypothetical protein FWB85_00850 [Chitinispirillia bacterium]|nr:hypothetical protein [Chitinispirillia bacterium]MCL2241050.1 hypothetical protein [Chitinispirillia bacterium]
MSVGQVHGSGATQAYYQDLNAKRAGGKANDAAADTKAAAGDQYTAGAGGGAKGVYSKDSASIQKLWDMAEAQHASMRRMVESIIGGNVGGAKNAGGTNGQAFWAMAANGSGNAVAGGFKVDEATQLKAQELTAEDGYFGIKQTTARIVDFAKAMAGSGASESKIEDMRKAVQDGFNAVANLFGGFDKMPELSQKTYDSVMSEFDNWVGGTKTSA